MALFLEINKHINFKKRKMKKLKLVMSLFIATFALNTQAQDDTISAPQIKFDKTVQDWGVINEGDRVETDFTFTNVGNAPLIITRIKGSCGCTVPSGWSKEPIAPGASSKFHVIFNSKGKPNKQQKTITIFSNTATGKDYVKIKAQVTPDAKQEQLRAERLVKRQEQAEKRKAERAQKLASKTNRIEKTEELKEKDYQQTKKKISSTEKEINARTKREADLRKEAVRKTKAQKRSVKMQRKVLKKLKRKLLKLKKK